MQKKPLKDPLTLIIFGRAATFLIAPSASIFELPGNWAQAGLDKTSASQAAT